MLADFMASIYFALKFTVLLFNYFLVIENVRKLSSLSNIQKMFYILNFIKIFSIYFYHNFYTQEFY